MTGIVLAGGESSRFGRPKWRARLGGQTLIEHAVDALQGWCVEVLVVGRGEALADLAHAARSARMVSDLPLGRGPLVGLASGLRASATAANAVIACDMPFADAALLQRLARGLGGHDAVVPTLAGRPQPLHAVYHRRCAGLMADALRRGVRAPTDFFQGTNLRVRYVGEQELSTLTSGPARFFSVNTPAELRRARDRVHTYSGTSAGRGTRRSGRGHGTLPSG